MANKRELDQKQEKKIGLFDFVGDISEHKNYLFDEDTKSAYNQFMINRALMQHIDTILLASEMNKCGGNITDEMHHDFLFYSVEPRRRYGKWAKKDDSNIDVLNYIKMCYNVNHEIAIMYFNLLTNEEIKEIETKLKAKGGKA